MNKNQFFIEAIQYKKHLKKAWVLGLFAVLHDRSYNPDIHGPYDIVSKADDKQNLYTILPDNPGELVLLEKTNVMQPPFHPLEAIDLKPGMLPNIYSEIRASVGTTLVNAQVLCWAFGGKVEFIGGKWKGKAVDKIVAKRLKDYPKSYIVPDKLSDCFNDPIFNKSGDTRNEPIYVHELLRYFKAMSNLGGYTQLTTPAASPKSLSIDPAILKRRDELLNEYRDQLNDPAIIAKIAVELSAMDKKSFEGDDAEGFLNIASKSYDIVRMKTYIMYGLEYGFNTAGEAPKFIPTSLADDMDMTQFPAFVNSIRFGSYSRGKETALGGYGVKEIYRILQNYTIADSPCNTKLGIPFLILKSNIKHLVDRYGIDLKTGKTYLLDENLLNANINKVIFVRSPGTCTSPGYTYCPLCIGEAYSKSKTALHSVGANVLSVVMNDSMKAMHGKKLATTRYNHLTAFS